MIICEGFTEAGSGFHRRSSKDHLVSWYKPITLLEYSVSSLLQPPVGSRRKKMVGLKQTDMLSIPDPYSVRYGRCLQLEESSLAGLL